MTVLSRVYGTMRTKSFRKLTLSWKPTHWHSYPDLDQGQDQDQDQEQDQRWLAAELVDPCLAVEEAHFEDGEGCRLSGPQARLQRHVWSLQGRVLPCSIDQPYRLWCGEKVQVIEE